MVIIFWKTCNLDGLTSNIFNTIELYKYDLPLGKGMLFILL